MMLMSDDSFGVWSGGDYSAGDGVEPIGGEFTMSDDDDFNMSIDLDSFYSILGEDPDAQQRSPQNPSFQNVMQGDSASISGNHENILLTKGSDYTMWNAKTLPESNRNCGKLELSTQIGSPLKMNCSETQSETLDCSKVGFPAGGVDHVPVCPLNADPNFLRGDVNSNYMSYSPYVEPLDINKENYGIPSDYQMDLGARGMESSSHTAHTEANFFQVSDNICSGFSPDMQYSMSRDDRPFDEPSDSHCLQFIPMNEPAIMDEKKFSTCNVFSNGNMTSIDQIGIPARHAPNMSVIDYYNSKCFRFKDGKHISPFSENCFPVGSVEPSIQTLSYKPNQKQEPSVKKVGMNGLITANCSTELMGKTVISSCAPGTEDILCMNNDLNQSFVSHRPHFSNMICTKNEKKDAQFPSKSDVHSEVTIKEIVRNLADREWMDVQKSTSMMKQLNHIKNENDRKMIQLMGSPLSKVSRPSTESIQSSPLIGDNTDICSLEVICMPAHPIPSLVQNSHVATKHSQLYDPLSHNGGGGQRLKTNDESNILQVALQDLSQPKAEASPPEGLLTVSLLRHQKIALSWMVQKETASLSCSGGILADDQGLGKTISTISLILTERSPSSKAYQKSPELSKPETLNLEDDDDLELDNTQISDASVQSRGRPAAGTLVVCPTSVLRQWAEELHNKVTGKANLSVLVYHGNNRTKDPCELAKYDVVITTYSIVSVEVPKQSLVDKDDDEIKKQEARVVQYMSLSSSKKRKYPPSSYSTGLKEKKGIDKALLESAARPLAKVGWFRVVLDEAQSIKNHRTQVARACWGLRAKRRWCLSGTPIQNSIDDLYSYFRFLRYDPYAVYTSFCSKIKHPVTKNPANGYRKLQAVLRTIMLRRTKGTLLDGEPIINLPPKSIELKRVDFSVEERDFYFRLEADSRAQFEEYAAAGTVKQNYVNILLMLLRLRQACDHPLLVKGCNPKSILKASVEIAKKLPRDKKTSLLTCLEASLALCGICNDPPEDAVVSICGHVFCNQCICEHLTSDDNKCPTTNCNVQLNVSSVFSKSTLNCSLDGQSGLEHFEALEPCFEGPSFSSSKIKAALEVLQSLSKPQYDTSCDESTSCSEVSSELGEVHKDMSDKGHIGVKLDKELNASTKVVAEKAIVFSQWTGMLDLLEACLKNSSIQYRRLDGTMSVLARDKAVKDFNTRPEVTVMIMSLKAASLGLNMVAACHVVMLDLWWNPTTEDQAIDRAHRIGQTRPVSVVRLTVRDTVEDRILALQQKKREMVASAFGEDETGSRQTRLTVDDLKYLFMA